MENATIVDKLRLFVSAMSNVVYFVVQVVLVFVASPLLVRGLGDDRYGVWMLVNSTVAYLALADLGIGAAVLRYVARFDGLHEEESLNRVFSTSMSCFAGAGVSVLIVTTILAACWKSPFGLTEDLAGDLRWMFAMLGLNLAVLLPMGIYKTVLMGLGRYPFVNVVRTTSLVLRNLGLVLVVYLGGGLRWIAATIVVCSLLDQLACFFAAHYYLPSLRFSVRFVDRKTLRFIWSYSAFVFLTTVIARIGSESTTVVIGAFLPTAAVTYFGIASNLSSQAGDGLRTAIAVLTPAVSRWDGVGHYAAIVRVFVTGTKFLLYVTIPIQMGLLFVGRLFIALWMGPRYAELCFPALAILTSAMPFALAMAMAGRILEGMGKVSILFWFAVVQAALAVGISLALARPFGVEGVACGAAVALLFQSVGVVVFACRVLGVAIATYILRAWLLPIVAASYLIALGLAVQSYLAPISTWTGLVATVFAGVALYVPFVICVDPDLRDLARRLSARLFSLSNEYSKTIEATRE